MKFTLSEKAAIILILVIGGSIFYSDYRTNFVFIPEPSARGEVFSVSSGDKGGPRIVNGFIDPFEPRVGERQVISVYTIDEAGVESIKFTVETDNKTKEIIPKLLDGTNFEGHWQGSWRVNDTSENIYNITILASSPKGDSEVTITL